MAILVVNCGSSSIKLSLFDEKLSLRQALHLKESVPIKQLLDRFGTVSAIGHRVVHGGDHFVSSTRIDTKVIEALRALEELAPLHNPASLAGIIDCRDYFGEEVPQVAVFDTAFHQTLPEVAKHYAIPQNLGIRRYGFHGISHAFLWDTYSSQVAKKAKVITLHLGNGCSMAAIHNGRSLDTSMGFTPAEGLVMATRAGDIDAAVMEFLCRTKKMQPEEVLNLLNFQSGLLGLSSTSSQMQTLLEERDKSPQLAIDLFCYRAQKYVGAYLTVMQGADSLIFSGGIGENAPRIRKQIVKGLEWLGCQLDGKANAKATNLSPGEVRKISLPTSSISLYVIATDENLYIAKEVRSLVS